MHVQIYTLLKLLRFLHFLSMHVRTGLLKIGRLHIYSGGMARGNTPTQGTDRIRLKTTEIFLSSLEFYSAAKGVFS